MAENKNPNIFLKIKYKFKEVFARLLIKISLFLNWPRLTVIAFWLASSRINPKCKSEYTVLCLGRSIFVDDVKAMATYSRRIRYVMIWRSYFQIILYHFLTNSERQELSENNYYTHDIGNEGKNRYYLYLKKMLPLLRKLMNFDAVLSCNFIFSEQQELARVCEENKMPFCVLFKEGLGVAASGAFEKWTELFKDNRFIGAKILLYGSKIAEILLSVNILGLAKEKIKIVGIPRLDHYFIKNTKINQKKQIVFFSFSSFVLHFLIKDTGKLERAKKRCDDFHAWIMKFAKNHPDHEVIIKTKFSKHYLDYINEIASEVFGKKGEKPANLVITNLGNPTQLIESSIAVAGFYSITLIEAIVAGKISLSPYFGDIITDKPWDYFAKYPELINYVKSEADLEEYILNPQKYLNYSCNRREEFLKELIHIPDGHASIRAEEAIIETIEESSNKK